MARTLHTFHGGIHPPEHKQESCGSPIAGMPLPRRLVLPLQQHLGAKARPLVKAGDAVLKGQMLAEAGGIVSSTVHAPTSGTVVDIGMHPVDHPSGLPDLCITLDSDGRDQWLERMPIDWRNLPRAEICARLRDGGIVGLGGAAFPTHIKVSTGRPEIETLVINGAECEPWITSDDRLMRERAEAVTEGIAILRHLVNAREVLIGIEDNKPEAIAAMEQACTGTGMEVVAIPTLYPAGGEKQLIRILTGKEVPSGGRPVQIGVVCNNVATAYAVQRLCVHGEPLISRIVTVTGNVARPGNHEVLIGTPVSELLAAAGGALAGTTGYISGGPMMGVAIPDTAVPVVKATNCVIARSEALFPRRPDPLACIRCGTCFRHCPVDLQPQELYWFLKSGKLDKAQEYNLFDCIECGTCSYVCPSNIPLVQYYRHGKAEIMARDKDKKASERARERHEWKEARAEREKQEKAARHAAAAARAAAAKETAAAGAGEADAAKKAAIQAALDRAQAQQTEHAQ